MNHELHTARGHEVVSSTPKSIFNTNKWLHSYLIISCLLSCWNIILIMNHFTRWQWKLKFILYFTIFEIKMSTIYIRITIRCSRIELLQQRFLKFLFQNISSNNMGPPVQKSVDIFLVCLFVDAQSFSSMARHRQ